MNWDNVNYFTPKEFYNSADLMHPTIIHNLDLSREYLKERIFPSPTEGALARFGLGKGSQHFVGIDPDHIVRQSTAADVFIEGIPFLNYNAIVNSMLFSGIGIYLDTHGPDGLPWVMFHLDIRKNYTTINPLVWIAIRELNQKGNSITTYHYPQNNSDLWKLLQRNIFFAAKEKE